MDCVDNNSEVTVYNRAVRVIDDNLDSRGIENKISDFITDVRSQVLAKDKSLRKISLSSDELMDTSEGSCEISPNSNNNFVTERIAQPGRSTDPNYGMTPRKSPEEHADEIVMDAERSKAHMYEVPGKDLTMGLSIAQMDEDYQMIDSHVDDTMKRKIQNLEFVDLGKLINRYKGYMGAGAGGEDDQRMEIVNRNGFTYLFAGLWVRDGTKSIPTINGNRPSMCTLIF